MTGATQPHTRTISSCSSNISNMLSSHELDLFELTRISGIIIDPQVFRILVELLKLDVSPALVFSVLQNMAYQVSASTLRKNTLNKNDSSQSSQVKKKPPVAAKPKKVKGESS